MPRRRLLAVLLVGAAGVGGLTGCRTSPDVAAYVGEEQVTVAELDEAVDARLADPAIAAYAAGNEVGYTRQVLSLQVGGELHEEVARRWDVEVSDADVRERITELLGGADPEVVFAQVAQQQGVNEADVVQNVRQQMIRERAAVAAGLAELSEAALRERYEEVRAGLAQVELGLVTVPDQATADAVLAQLTADPAGYPALAAQYAGPNTLPQIEPRAPADLPEVLAAPIAATPAGQGFTLALPEAGGVVVGFVRDVAVPTFEELRPQLADAAAAEAAEAGIALVTEVREDLDLVVNPRFGVLEEGQVVAADGGVVQLLEDAREDAAGVAGD
ncbi:MULTISPECIES: peptidylprolyl isomerase [unclassified Modestobacter]|uniref:peptidylprolyl isomerase n=1 Tax=unclassified Modestobacter TaxID=2643866 RepID=UPI0022AB3042|nr:MULTISPECIES: peptidylprolyl isomerase [unclassified Modestobacter]MCZ2825170.1 peptidylprolyl isomerase [Modestobacter sp. VKM Ac-2981]MCZ2853765.1 peptidylprolyl isomerase [Modestobacter sp. VKM Ac-2982]